MSYLDFSNVVMIDPTRMPFCIRCQKSVEKVIELPSKDRDILTLFILCHGVEKWVTYNLLDAITMGRRIEVDLSEGKLVQQPTPEIVEEIEKKIRRKVKF